MSSEVRAVRVALRPETPDDEAFVRSLILETAAAELGASAWPEPMRSQLLGMQYTGRRQSHRMKFPEARNVVLEADGTRAGWMVVTETRDAVYLAEIMVIGRLRGGGIGTAAIGQILAAASEAAKPVRLNVNVTNAGAIGLYERLGFRRTGGDEVQHLMEWRTEGG